MAQFDFFPYRQGYLLDVQADLLGGFNTRMVVPLLPLDEAPVPAQGLNPILTVNGAGFAMVTQFMAAVAVSELGAKAGSLAHLHDRIKPAIDLLFDGV